MRDVTETRRNPFDMSPPCERYVPGFGDPNAHFHVIGDNPGSHGGLSTEIPFTDHPWSATFFETLEDGGLVEAFDLATGSLTCPGTFFSYRCLCTPDGESPTAEEYARTEPYFDAELRAITAHVLLPVGAAATARVLAQYTARSVDGDPSMASLHATDIRGSGWLVVPIEQPADWDQENARALVETLRDLQASDYRQMSDLGRFIPGETPYFVR